MQANLVRGATIDEVIFKKDWCWGLYSGGIPTSGLITERCFGRHITQYTPVTFSMFMFLVQESMRDGLSLTIAFCGSSEQFGVGSMVSHLCKLLRSLPCFLWNVKWHTRTKKAWWRLIDVSFRFLVFSGYMLCSKISGTYGRSGFSFLRRLYTLGFPPGASGKEATW